MPDLQGSSILFMLAALGGGSRSNPCRVWKCADMGDDWPSMSSTVPGLHTTLLFINCFLEW